MALEPRLNFSYTVDPRSTIRWSYNRLFNTPPVAQGADVGSPIQPEVLDQYDISAEHDLSRGQRIKVAYYVKQMTNQVDTGLLIPGSQIGLYSAVNFQRGAVHGAELTYSLAPSRLDSETKNRYGWDAFLNYSYSIAAPNGLDNTGAPAPDFNDHDQLNTLSVGANYNWVNGATAGFIVNHGSGLASSPIPPSFRRVPRSAINLQLNSGPKLFQGRGGLSVKVENLLNDQSVINFQSGFSGTRFVQGRRLVFSLFGTF